MEYAQNGELFDYLIENKSLPEDIAIDLFRQMVLAIEYLHIHGICHRDLKPENILLDSNNRVKIADFGFARLIPENDIKITGKLGTLAYMSPEMIDSKDYDNKTDVYSFGILLHFIFVGNTPKQNLSDKVTGKKVKLPSPSAKISSFCIKLIEKCLSFSPSKRPSFEEILNELRENSYDLAQGVDPSILSIRDKQLEFIENYK